VKGRALHNSWDGVSEISIVRVQLVVKKTVEGNYIYRKNSGISTHVCPDGLRSLNYSRLGLGGFGRHAQA
jgi:hypothetical protein